MDMATRHTNPQGQERAAQIYFPPGKELSTASSIRLIDSKGDKKRSAPKIVAHGIEPRCPEAASGRGFASPRNGRRKRWAGEGREDNLCRRRNQVPGRCGRAMGRWHRATPKPQPEGTGPSPGRGSRTRVGGTVLHRRRGNARIGYKPNPEGRQKRQGRQEGAGLDRWTAARAWLRRQMPLGERPNSRTAYQNDHEVGPTASPRSAYAQTRTPAARDGGRKGHLGIRRQEVLGPQRTEPTCLHRISSSREKGS